MRRGWLMLTMMMRARLRHGKGRDKSHYDNEKKFFHGNIDFQFELAKIQFLYKTIKNPICLHIYGIKYLFFQIKKAIFKNSPTPKMPLQRQRPR